MIDVQNMSKKYGKLVANDNINLSVGRGELAVLLGPNGAGKSTLIKSICGLLRFQGTITINGQENNTVEAKRLLGYVPEFPVLYPMLTVGEHLEFIAKAYRLRIGRKEERHCSIALSWTIKMKLGKELLERNAAKVSVCCASCPSLKLLLWMNPWWALTRMGSGNSRRSLPSCGTAAVPCWSALI